MPPLRSVISHNNGYPTSPLREPFGIHCGTTSDNRRALGDIHFYILIFFHSTFYELKQGIKQYFFNYLIGVYGL